MLKTIFLHDNCKTDGCALVLGGFDGVHIGHRRLFERAKAQGKAVGATTILGAKGEVLFTLDERLAMLADAGVDFVVAFDFEDIRDNSAEEFLSSLEEAFAPSLYVCGTDFRFGKGAQGDADTIAKISKVPVAKEELVVFGGEKVATRHLKTLLAEGELAPFTSLLGSPYFIVGTVVRGRQIGRIIGFPTANIAYPVGKTPLKIGVYAVKTEVDGKKYTGIANFGAQPTVGKTEVRLEVHLIGFDGDLYDKKLKVEFLSYLRPVKKFGDLDELREQLEKDKEMVKNYD